MEYTQSMENKNQIIEAAPARLAPERLKTTGKKFRPTPEVLAVLEQLADVSSTRQMAAEALSISAAFLSEQINTPGAMQAAWYRGKAIRAVRISQAAKAVERGIIVNAVTPTKIFPGGNVQAQALFLDKILGADNENTTQTGQATQTDEVIFRRVRPTATSFD